MTLSTAPAGRLRTEVRGACRHTSLCGMKKQKTVMKKDRRKRRHANQSEHYGGVRLQTVNSIMIMVVVGVSIILLVSIDRMTNTYHELKKTTDTYIACQDDGREVMEASDYLTDSARAFAATGDVKYLDDYFAESKEIQRREKAVENMESYMPESEARDYLDKALEESQELMDMEYYSMRLVIEAKGYDPKIFPEEIQNVVLSKEDQNASKNEKADRALQIVYNDEYQTQKNTISRNVQACLKQVLRTLQDEEDNNFLRMENAMHRVSLLIGAMMFLFLVLIFMIVKLVIRPLENNIDFLNSKTHLPMRGSFELQYMAYVYNRIFDENQEKSDRLAYEAVHDRLTGAYNRAGFEEKMQTVDQSSITLILLDIDHFKGINDAYGHGSGDMILKQVVTLIRENFRQEDCVCRIGGDEFAIIMLFTDSSLRDIVTEKFEIINDALSHPAGSLPAASLSAGVAFCDRSNPTDNMFKDADETLYMVKRTGRNNIGFYGEGEPPAK